MNRLEVVWKIDDLQDNNCKTCTKLEGNKRRYNDKYCLTQCEIGLQLQELGNQLKTRERKTMGEKKLVLDQDSYKMLKANGKSDADISRHFGIKQPTLAYHKKKWFNEAVKPTITIVEPVKATEKPAESKPTRQDKESEYAALINELSDKVKQQEGMIEKLQAKVDEYEHLNDACSDVEEETASLQKEVDYLSSKRIEEKEEYLNTLEKLKETDYELQNHKKWLLTAGEEINAVKKENQHLWGLLKLKAAELNG